MARSTPGCGFWHRLPALVPTGAKAGGRAVAAALAVALAGAAALAGCTSGPSLPTPTSGSSATGSSTATTSASVPVTSATATATGRPTRPSTLIRYDVTTLIGANIFDFPVGRPGPHGGVLLAQTVGTNVITVSGATGPVSLYLPCCRDLSHSVLDYQIGTRNVTDPTQIPIDDDQGLVLDGRLVALHGIVQVGSQPRVQAQVIVFPAAAARGLPTVH